MKSSGPYITPEGRDRLGNTFLWYFMQILLWIYIVGFVAQLVLTLNLHPQYTYFKSLPYGSALFSTRYSTQWIFVALAALRIMVPVAALSLILYRRIGCCNVFWFITLLLFVILDVLVFVSYIGGFILCNGQTQPNNACNDLLWCCVPEIYSNPGNMCPNAGPCNPPVALADLRANPDFLWLFWTTLAFVVLDLLLLMIPIGLWLGQNNPGLLAKKTPVKETKEAEEDFYARAPHKQPGPRKIVHTLAKPSSSLSSSSLRPAQHFMVKKRIK